MSKSTLCKRGRKLGFCYMQCNKMQAYQQSDVDARPLAWNFVKNKTPTQAFLRELCKILNGRDTQ